MQHVFLLNRKVKIEGQKDNLVVIASDEYLARQYAAGQVSVVGCFEKIWMDEDQTDCQRIRYDCKPGLILLLSQFEIRY